jgi:cystathionine beta-lyase/cystathionine gamma-synthase
VHSVSKYLGGHSDLIAGVVLGRAADVDAIATREAELLGGKMAPFEAWLLLRSLRTLPVRMAAHERNGLAVARFLEQRIRRWPKCGIRASTAIRSTRWRSGR